MLSWFRRLFGYVPSGHIGELGLPVRVHNLLLGAGIRTVEELALWRVSDLRKVRGLGDVYCALIERVMVERGLWR